MQNERRSIFSLIENYVDMLLNIISIYIAFFFSCLVEEPAENLYPTLPGTIIFILLITLALSLIYQLFNVYRPTVFIKSSKAKADIIRANLTAFSILTLVIMLFAREGNRGFLAYWIAITFITSTTILSFKRKIVLFVLSALREKQYILRKVIIVGDNTASAKAYVDQISSNPNYGMMILGYIGDKMDEEEVGCDKLGAFRDLEKLLDKHCPTDVVFAIDSYNKRHLIKLVNLCDDRCIKVYFLPVTYGFFKSSRQIEQIGNLPIINIHATPLDNRANAVIKRLIDIVGASLLILLTSPIMIFAAIGTKCTSKGPIFFKQKRIGKLGKSFTMLKFRSMVVNEHSDDTWSAPGDTRTTRFGSFLRRTAIDELPQFFNVLAGHMSLVGPRPEIPKFVEEFRETVPLYMIKHYVRPGITGLAQIKGLRGDTSLEDRIHEDISYLENWSLALDFMILLKTPFKAFNKSEKYVEPEMTQEGAEQVANAEETTLSVNATEDVSNDYSGENNCSESGEIYITDIPTEAPDAEEKPTQVDNQDATVDETPKKENAENE